MQKTGERRIEERAGGAATPTIPPAAKTTKEKHKNHNIYTDRNAHFCSCN